MNELMRGLIDGWIYEWVGGYHITYLKEVRKTRLRVSERRKKAAAGSSSFVYTSSLPVSLSV